MQRQDGPEGTGTRTVNSQTESEKCGIRDFLFPCSAWKVGRQDSLTEGLPLDVQCRIEERGAAGTQNPMRKVPLAAGRKW